MFYSNIYIQQYATLHSLFYLETTLHVSGGTTNHHQERKQLYLQHLVFVTPLLLSVAIDLASYYVRVRFALYESHKYRILCSVDSASRYSPCK